MSNMAGLNNLVAEIKSATDEITKSDQRLGQRVDSVEKSINDLYRRSARPSTNPVTDDEATERKDAEAMCRIRHSVSVTKYEDVEFVPAANEIDQAISAQKALSQYLRHGNIDRLQPEFRKSLSSFSFGPPGDFLLAPTQAGRVLSCLADPTDLSGLFDQVTISGPSLVYSIDNARMGMGAGSCESGCFANNPMPDLNEGLGTLEVKPETLRFDAQSNLGKFRH